MSTKSRKRVVAVAPARYGSTRFPDKVVAEILGKPMIQWVCQGARSAETLDEIWVPTCRQTLSRLNVSCSVTRIRSETRYVHEYEKNPGQRFYDRSGGTTLPDCRTLRSGER